MTTRKYYSLRTGRHPDSQGIDLPTLKGLFLNVYSALNERGYFQEFFGFYCVDADFVPGKVGVNVESVIKFRLRKDRLWPVAKHIDRYSEDDLFDMLEFLYDHVSKPLGGYEHTFNNCGWHYDKFDIPAGRAEFKTEVNQFLSDYKTGYELTDDGEIAELPDEGLEPLLRAEVPVKDEKILTRVASAVMKFRRYKATPDERRDAVRDLADVLEYLRPSLKMILSNADEGDLFNIANNFSIRHYNEKQKGNYDGRIWLNWIFYIYLATIHAGLRMLAREEAKKPKK